MFLIDMCSRRARSMITNYTKLLAKVVSAYNTHPFVSIVVLHLCAYRKLNCVATYSWSVYLRWMKIVFHHFHIYTPCLWRRVPHVCAIVFGFVISILQTPTASRSRGVSECEWCMTCVRFVSVASLFRDAALQCVSLRCRVVMFSFK